MEEFENINSKLPKGMRLPGELVLIIKDYYDNIPVLIETKTFSSGTIKYHYDVPFTKDNFKKHIKSLIGESKVCIKLRLKDFVNVWSWVILSDDFERKVDEMDESYDKTTFLINCNRKVYKEHYCEYKHNYDSSCHFCVENFGNGQYYDYDPYYGHDFDQDVDPE